MKKKQSWRCRIIIAGAGNASPILADRRQGSSAIYAFHDAKRGRCHFGVCRVLVDEGPKMRQTVVPDVPISGFVHYVFICARLRPLFISSILRKTSLSGALEALIMLRIRERVVLRLSTELLLRMNGVVS